MEKEPTSIFRDRNQKAAAKALHDSVATYARLQVRFDGIPVKEQPAVIETLVRTITNADPIKTMENLRAAAGVMKILVDHRMSFLRRVVAENAKIADDALYSEADLLKQLRLKTFLDAATSSHTEQYNGLRLTSQFLNTILTGQNVVSELPVNPAPNSPKKP